MCTVSGMINSRAFSSHARPQGPGDEDVGKLPFRQSNYPQPTPPHNVALMANLRCFEVSLSCIFNQYLCGGGEGGGRGLVKLVSMAFLYVLWHIYVLNVNVIPIIFVNDCK